MPTKSVALLKNFHLTLQLKVRIFQKHYSMSGIDLLLGHYKALEWNEEQKSYILEPTLGIIVEVDVCLCDTVQCKYRG